MAGSDRPGRLVLVVGPSGAGKDTLIAGAREALAGDPRYVFLRRVVTRPEGAHEAHDSLGEAEFKAAEGRGAFALAWRAHGLAYGVPAEIRTAVEQGGVAVVNVSRAIIPAARQHFPYVSVVLITAPPAVLAARIAARGRDQAEGSRSDPARADGVSVDATIVNDGAPEAAISRFVALLKTL